jgi:chromosome segregation protein
VLNVEPEYEKAVEAALSDRIKGFFVATKDDIRRSVELVSRKNLSRTTFIPLETRGVKIEPEGKSAERGGVEPLKLSALVRSESRYTSYFNQLLKDYLLVEDLESGLRMIGEMAEDPPSVRLVTLNGEVIEPGGVVTCGKSFGILELRRHLRGLQSEIEGKEAVILQTEESMERCSARIEELKTLLRDLDADVVSQEKELSSLQASERRLSEERERFSKKAGFIRIEIDELHKERESLEKIIREKKEEIRAAEEKKNSLESGLDEMKEEISQRRDEIETKRHSVTELKLRLKEYIERIRGISRERKGLEEEIRTLGEKSKSLMNEIKSNRETVEKKRRVLEELENRLKEKVSEAGRLREKLSVRRESLNETRETINTDEAVLRKEREALEKLNVEIHESEVSKTEVSIRLTNLTDSIRERYGVDLEKSELPLSVSYEEDSETALMLKEKIQSMGTVNLAALDEFNELSQRYEFLKGQHDDIVQSIEELQDAIGRINRTTKKRLREAFDSLNRKFNEVFRLLFGGGSAELKLTDENNILESGIEIKVQPPGKKLQNISLLSGGEKALAALSTLFAGFLLKPTPLCILDEADAPLDESNTERFRSMIKEISKEIQFIVITHNRITMEISDYLYGITMEEPGTSKVLSMEFV